MSNPRDIVATRWLEPLDYQGFHAWGSGVTDPQVMVVYTDSLREYHHVPDNARRLRLLFSSQAQPGPGAQPHGATRVPVRLEEYPDGSYALVHFPDTQVPKTWPITSVLALFIKAHAWELMLEPHGTFYRWLEWQS